MSTPSIDTKIYQANKARIDGLPMASQYPIKWADGPAYEPHIGAPHCQPGIR